VLAIEHRLLPAAVLAAAAAGRPVPFRLDSDDAGSGATSPLKIACRRAASACVRAGSPA